ncbi:hypothetical protein [Lactobacillus sp. UCMA15818]|uniref:hypothetical protein n=1 Tax=Lactobacillus sp. UCMA15818 TaxID=2583394 RepID=UPI0025AF656C|nr:hypothetical protein [Lactobacillus sp. UCMA15818]MDN2452511.1 hypothetical protein [Lactobacillus sp. UCMA15818]
MGGRGSSSGKSGSRGSSGPKTSSFSTLKSLADKIANTSMKGHVEKGQTVWIGKDRAKKIGKAFKWANSKGFGDISINGKNLSKVVKSTRTGSEYKAARLLGLGKL